MPEGLDLGLNSRLSRSGSECFAKFRATALGIPLSWEFLGRDFRIKFREIPGKAKMGRFVAIYGATNDPLIRCSRHEALVACRACEVQSNVL